MPEWRNWSGSVVARPAEIASPRTEAELAQIVGRTPRLRVAGSGHSFTPLCETDGLLVSLSELEGRLEVAPDRKSAWAPAGWSLDKLTRALWDEGLCLPNQGDINRQALAGALATGTHGTGRELKCLSAISRRFRLMLADGSVVTCGPGEREPLYQAQRLSLGLFGVVLAVEIEVVPAYHLEERIERRPMEEVLESFADWGGELRHAEFWVFPYSDVAIVKFLHPAEDDGSFNEPGQVDETVFRLCCELSAAAPNFTSTLQRLLVRGSGKSRRVGPAHRIFPSERTVPFEEMEYELPRESALAVLSEAIAWIRKSELPVTFPFEFRWTAADDIWLSPFNAGDCAAVSMHQFARMPWQGLFAEGEAIFRGSGGRPHWGKRHTLTREDVDRLYPRAEQFRRVRREHDPDDKFLNPHLSELFS